MTEGWLVGSLDGMKADTAAGDTAVFVFVFVFISLSHGTS